jgi:hypothetical protein
LIAVLALNVLVAGFLNVRDAYACSCAGAQSPDEELESSDAVFVGEAVKSGLEDPKPQDDAPFGGIRFDVKRSWKGVAGDSVVIYGQASSYYGPPEEGEMVFESSCAVDLNENQTYLVFASRSERDDFLVANACGNTSYLAGTKDALEALGRPGTALPDTGGPGLPLRAMMAAVVGGFSLALAGGLAVARRRRGGRT